MADPEFSNSNCEGRAIDSTDPDTLTLRRADLAAMLASYRRETRRPRAWAGLVTGIGGLFLAALLTTLGSYLKWPEALGPVFLAGGWAIMLVSLGVVWRRERRLRGHFQFHCPACEEPLLDGNLSPRAELAIATGNCPRCGAHILAP